MDAEDEQQPELRQSAAQRSVAPEQMHAWIMEAMDRHGLELRRAVATTSSNQQDIRVPERLRQAGSKLVGRTFVRSKVCPHSAAAAPLKADFQMKATLDEGSYLRMHNLAVEYNLFTRGSAGDNRTSVRVLFTIYIALA